MKTILFLAAGFYCFTSVLGQLEPVHVTDQTIKIPGLETQSLYYGFAAGDEIVFSFEEVNGKPLKVIEIIEYPENKKFSEFKAVSIAERRFTTDQKGIYEFRFSNEAIAGRICKIKIQRVPAAETTKQFSTSVDWKTIYDSTYTTEYESYLIKADTTFSDFYSSTPQISSQNALNGNKNYQVIDFMLPANTIAWSFYIGTGTEGKAEYDRAQQAFLKSATFAVSRIPGYGAMAALALTGVSYFSKVQGADNVKYWFLSSSNDAALFESNQAFRYYKTGDVVNEFSQMTLPLKGKVYIALLNDNVMDVITVTVRATAVIVTEEWGTRPVQVLKVKTREEPYLED